MKRITHRPEPQALIEYRALSPGSTWVEMCDDALQGGKAAHRAIKRATLAQQRCLCAYCELRLNNVVPDPDVDVDVPGTRIEHFHPKSDNTTQTNWHLVWNNLFAVCNGGSQWPPRGGPLNSRFQVLPRKENLSCDAHKDRQIDTGKLALQPEGWILSPDIVTAFPSLVQFDVEGEIQAHNECDNQQIVGNRHANTSELVDATIRHLNLNCRRLSRLRKELIDEVDEELTEIRNEPRDVAEQTMIALAEGVFSENPFAPWPEFFTLYRYLLGNFAETRLQQIGYTG